MGKKHLEYSKTAKEAIKNFIDERFPENKEEIFKKFDSQYNIFLEDFPYIGGSKNRQSRGVYDSIAIFALYEATGKNLTLKELEEVNSLVFVEPYKKMKFVNMNNKAAMFLSYMAFKTIEKNSIKHRADWPKNYIMEVERLNFKEGIKYKFKSCPIADFAKEHGYTDIMGAFCNGDYPMLSCMHASLIRKKTCALDEYCDYNIIGDKKEIGSKHEVYRDEYGFLRNK